MPGALHIFHAKLPLPGISLLAAARTSASSVDRWDDNDLYFLFPPDVSPPAAFCPPVAIEPAAKVARLPGRTATDGHVRHR